MSRLPLLRIPLLAQLEILKHVDTFDLICLSFCSEKTRILVENADAPLDSLKFQFDGSEDFVISVNDGFRMSCFQQPMELNRPNTVWFEEQESKREVELLETTESFESLRERLIGHFLYTFRRVDDVCVWNAKTAIQNIPLWKFTKSIDQLFLHSVPERILSIEDMKFIFEELTIRKRFHNFIPVTDEFRYSQGFQQKLFQSFDAKWVELDAILNSQSRNVFLSGMEKPTAAQLNCLLKLWMSKEKMPDLESMRLCVESENKFDDAFLTEVLDGIVHDRNWLEFAEIQRVDGKVARVGNRDNTEIWFKIRD